MDLATRHGSSAAGRRQFSQQKNALGLSMISHELQHVVFGFVECPEFQKDLSLQDNINKMKKKQTWDNPPDRLRPGSFMLAKYLDNKKDEQLDLWFEHGPCLFEQ